MAKHYYLMYQMSGTKPNGNEVFELHSFFLIGNRNFIEIDEFFFFLGDRNFIEIDEHCVDDNNHSEMKQNTYNSRTKACRL